jgi:hypothetical protein
VASAAVGALVAGLLAGLAAPAATASTTASTTAHHLHAGDRVYRRHVVHVPRSFFGLHDASGLAYQHLPFGSLRLWDSGTTWRDIETAPGVYDWSRLDSLVAGAQAHHVQVTLVLAMTPSFYGPSPTLAPTDLSAYASYVRAVMTRYRDFEGRRGIASYQVWNEGNVSTFWTDTPAQLARLTQIVDQVRDQVDPGATVVAPSFALRMRYQRRWFSWYQRQTVDGLPVWRYYDVNALSLYPRVTYGRHLGGPEDAMALVTDARHRRDAAGVPHAKKLWASEVNYGVRSGPDGAEPAYPLSERRQVANVLRTYLLGAAHGLSRVFWYRYDWGRVVQGTTLANTLLSDPDDYNRLTPAGHALATARKWLRGRLVGTHGRKPCARGPRGTYGCTVRYHGVTRTIYWNPHRHLRVHVRRPVRRDGTLDRRLTRTVRVGFQPVVVRTRR